MEPCPPAGEINLAKENLKTLFGGIFQKMTYETAPIDTMFFDSSVILQTSSVYDEETLLEHLQNVLRYFLFACYTGLTWGDLVSFNNKEIEKEGETCKLERTPP